jgi:hypothetical protein
MKLTHTNGEQKQKGIVLCRDIVHYILHEVGMVVFNIPYYTYYSIYRRVPREREAYTKIWPILVIALYHNICISVYAHSLI